MLTAVRFLILGVVALLFGCSTVDVAYLEAQAKAAQATAVVQAKQAEKEAEARIAEANALADILKKADISDQSKALAAMVWMVKGRSGGAVAVPQQMAIVAPAPKENPIYSLVGGVTNSLLQYLGIRYNYRLGVKQSDNATALGIKQSDNATALGISTNGTFSSIAGYIQSPAANISTVTNNTDSSNRSVTTTDNSNRSTVDSHNTTTTTTTTTTSNANPSETYSLQGTSVVNKGTYSTSVVTPVGP